MALLLTQPKIENTKATDWLAIKVPDKPTSTSEHRPAAAAVTVNFTRDIAPILDRSCAGCHSDGKRKGRFSIATREAMIKGGQSGEPALHPGSSADSKLIRMVTDQVEDLEMPPLAKRSNYPALTTAQVALLKTWIDEGLPWDASSRQQP